MPPLLTLASPTPASAARFALSVTETQDWLASLPRHNAVEAGRCILEQVAALNRSRTPVRERLVLTALLRDYAEQLLPDLDSQIAGAHVPLQPKPRAVARLIDDLLREFGSAYKLAVAEIQERWFKFGLARRLHLPITRALQMLSRRLVLAHRIYAPAPPGVWLEMHALFKLASEHRIEKLSLAVANDSPLAIYRGALCLNFAAPHKLMQGELDLALDFLAHSGDLAVFIAAVPLDPVDGLFVVQTERDSPGVSWSKRHARNHGTTLGPDELVLNTSRLADRAIQLLELAEELPQQQTQPESDRRHGADLLRRLVKHWTASVSRQYSRLRRHARVDLCVGLHGIWRFLRQPDDANGLPSSEWMVNNESPGGFALMHVSGPVEPVKVGEVLGVRSRDSDRVHICIVRWVLSDSPEHVELGLEELSPNAKPVSIARLATSGGVAPGAEPGLLLPEIPALKRAAAILTMPGSLDSSSEFHLGEPAWRARTTQLVEQTRSLALFQFSPVN
jgi:hypothetical protein